MREGWRLGLPAGGKWREVLNTDSRFYGGSDVGNGLGLEAEKVPWNEQDVLGRDHAAAARSRLARPRAHRPKDVGAELVFLKHKLPRPGRPASLSRPARFSTLCF